MLIGAGFTERELQEQEIRNLLAEGLGDAGLDGRRVLVIIPDSTRSGPTGELFRMFHELLGERVAALHYLIALGTHQPMSNAAIHALLGVSAEEMNTRYAGVSVFNHHWEDPANFTELGTIPAAEIARLSDGRFEQDLPITLNRLVLDYDRLIVCGPVFPHEVAGFSGGNKYFFPGISGPELIDLTHWLGALITCSEIIGAKHTPVRAVIDRAAAMIPTPRLACCYVVRDGTLAGLYLGDVEESWSAAADLSSQLHVRYVEAPFKKVLSLMPPLYDDIWTAAKGMYKLEPVVADGGELIIHAPQINEISYTHGAVLDRIGYHVRDYFTAQWSRFEHEPWGVLAHSTHLKGAGRFVDGVETPRVQVTLATGIPEARCRAVNLGYRDPATIDVTAWQGREDEGILVVPHAGEILYRLKPR